ncbi:MAG: aminotransferase class III-fold pyridoxal phosphate-dependent enzyme, partial [Deltaproteobacteria bacterium]|nr:aminotransferase class III-fold pyridoxal phosphate-dependent enzyme [Deltaproteobacteria bacterium]
AIKTARKWGYQKKKISHNKAEIIVCANNFHGRTTTIVGFSTEKQYRDGFGPFTPGFKIIPYGDFKALKKTVTKNTVAFLVEPIQGEAGIIVPKLGYLTEAKKLCNDKNVLFVLDEIQTGLGRTGKNFCYEHEKNAKPDIIILGKALGGGVYPVSAIVASKEILGVFRPGDHGSTFGGNPLASAVGLAALEVIETENLANRSFELGQELLKEIIKINSAHIKELRGRGLMIGIEIKKSSGTARTFCEKLMHLGILAKETHGQVIRLSPPLIIAKQELDFLVEALRDVLS